MLLGNAVMINWSDVAPEHRSAYYEWHSREHMVGRVAIPGFKRGRRYIAAQASRDFLVCYEVEDVSVLTSKAYLDKANAPSALSAAHDIVPAQRDPRPGARAVLVRYRYRVVSR